VTSGGLLASDGASSTSPDSSSGSVSSGTGTAQLPGAVTSGGLLASDGASSTSPDSSSGIISSGAELGQGSGVVTSGGNVEFDPWNALETRTLGFSGNGNNSGDDARIAAQLALLGQFAEAQSVHNGGMPGGEPWMPSDVSHISPAALGHHHG
jgi:hypothetical protein